MLRHPCILGDLQQRGTKELVASPLPFRGPKKGRKCYVTTACSGSPNKREQNQKWLPHPCLLEGPKEGRIAMSPLHSRGTRTKGNKIRSGRLTPTFLGVPNAKRGEQNQKCHRQRATKSEVAASPLPSWGPKRGRKCYVTPAFLGVPNAKRGEQNQKCHQQWATKMRIVCLTLACLGAQKRAEMIRHPCIPGGPQRQARGAKSEVSPAKGNKIKSGCLTLAFLGAHKRAEMLCHPCILRGPQHQARGAKSELSPTKGNKNKKWLPHPCLLGGPKEGGNATTPLHSRGSPTKRNKIRSGYLNPAFSGAQ